MTNHTHLQGRAADGGMTGQVLRLLTLSVVTTTFIFLANDVLTYWYGWPGLLNFFADRGWFALTPPRTPLESGAIVLGWLQLALYLVPILAVAAYVALTPGRPLEADSHALGGLATYIVRAAFWAVLMIGLVDMLIAFLRVENYLEAIVGDEMTLSLGRTAFRGAYVHYPLILAGMIIAGFTRTLGFIWFALLIVLAELMIVIARFVFSYEQVFMGDLVRFWYAALFLFSSAYTLSKEGHVRVDILYTRFSARGKAWANCIGSVLFGIPLCWVILTRGLWNKSAIINAPLLNYEVSQSGYGMYVKYLMAGFLLIYALSMMVQFASSFLSNAAVLLRKSSPAMADQATEGMGRGAVLPGAG